FHVWSDEWVDQGGWADAVERLKRDGKIRFFGVSINDHQPANAVRLVESGLVDTVQVIYNVFDQSPEDELFPAVEAAGVGVIARMRSVENVERNVAAAGQGELTGDELAKLRAHRWVRSFYAA